MHREERDRGAREREPEARLREPLVVHPSADLREPVEQPAEEREDGRAEDDEVEVRDDVVRVGRRLVDRDRGERDPGQAAENEEDDEAADEHQRRPELGPAERDSHGPGEDLNRAGNHHHHARGREENERDRWQPGREHVMRPDAEADEGDEQLRERDQRERQHPALGEGGDDRGRDPERG